MVLSFPKPDHQTGMNCFRVSNLGEIQQEILTTCRYWRFHGICNCHKIKRSILAAFHWG